jgi:hypothetical protein
MEETKVSQLNKTIGLIAALDIEPEGSRHSLTLSLLLISL